ncbi:lipopolysaccharide biosynthesis protein [Streptomyces sp. E11-3]|uniref:polysaccharide biosynthesis C-terminal domain-containing protein n=1 Tax=Streptomyces sp. E11-3 TaxID=3110112 RepID=UPI00397F6AD3
MADTTTQAGAEATEATGAAGQPPAGRRLRLPLKSSGGSPLFRNAYALMLNTCISGVLGLGFWLAAARYYSDSAVGQGSAAIAAMKLLAGLTAVTLTGALARFIPVAGRATGRFIFRTYAGSSLLVAVAAGIFLLTLDLWGPSYRFLHGPLNGIGFILAVVAWSVLTLQDGVLTGLRNAIWVPVGNTVFSVVKLVLLIAFAAAIPTAGVFVSWVAAIGLSVLPLGWLVFRRLVPRHVRATEGKSTPPTARELGRFLAGDYTGALFSLAVVYLVPVIVAAQVASVDNAYFYITTTIGGTVNLLAINMGASLTVEGSHDPARLAANCRAALRRMARIMLPVCGVLFIGAPYILGAFGQGYADAATGLLRVFAVGALLRVVIETYFAVLRAQSRTSGLAYLQGALCALVLGLTLLLLPRMGLIGAGVAEVSSLAVIAAIAGFKLYRIVRSVPPSEGRPATVAPDGDLADLGTAETTDSDSDTVSLAKDLGQRPTWALRRMFDSETLELGVRIDIDHQERRPDLRVGRVGQVGHGPPAPDAPDVPDVPTERDDGEGDGGKAESAERTGPPADTGTVQIRGLFFGDVQDSVSEDAVREDAVREDAVREDAVREDAPQPAAEGDEMEHRPTWALKAPLTLPEPRPASTPESEPSQEVSADPGPAPRSPHAAPIPDPTPPDPPQEEPELAPAAPRGSRAYGVGLLFAVALALFWVPVFGMGEADLDAMGGLGLVSVLPPATLVGAGLLVIAFASLLWHERPHRLLLTLVLLATLVSLHALPAVIEAEPRFATAWQHLGFLEYIDRTGTAAPDLDARFSWPGFFAAAVFVAEACGISDLSGVLRWWPLTIQLLYLAPMFLLMRSMRAGWRAQWTGIWIFVLSGWVGQDYFSPQGFTYLLYLVFVAILLVWFRAPRMLWTRRRPGEAEVEPTTRGQRAALLLVLLALFAATVPTHQLTPFVMLGVLAALVMVGRSELRGLPILFCVLVAVWVGFFAEPYWSGHFDELFGGVGGVGGNVTSSVSGRIEGGSSTHQLVLYARVALAGSVMALACWGWLRRRTHQYAERSLLVLTFVPFLGFGMQSYGGEMALRVFMFALPGAALLAGLALFPRTGVTAKERDKDRVSLAPLAALLVGLILVGGFLIARWGNEPFERVRPGEVAAMEYVYENDRPTTRLLWMSNDTLENVTPAMPWGSRDMERVQYVPTLAPPDPVLVSGLVKALKDAGPNSYLMVNRSQATYLSMDVGYPRNWEARVIRSLDDRPELTKVFANDDASLFVLKKQPDGPVEKPDPGPPGPKVTWTPWSVVGGFAAVALIVLLTAREVVRVSVRPSARQLRWLQSTFWFSLPLLAVLLASLVQRFLTMA